MKKKIIKLFILALFSFSLFLITFWFYTKKENIEDDFQIIEISKDDIFFVNKNKENYNLFVEENGLFSFYYKNNFRVKKTGQVYFLESLKNKKVGFRIFGNTENNYGDFNFDKKEFNCIKNQNNEYYQHNEYSENIENSKNSENSENKVFCFTKKFKNEIITNLKFSVDSKEYFQEKINYFKKKGINLEDLEDKKLITRAEALNLVLRLKYSEIEFSEYIDRCFFDITLKTRFAGEICYAKKKNIIEGIDGKFFPNRNINLLGLLKILLKTYDKKYTLPKENYFIKNIYHQMKLFSGGDILLFSLKEGLFSTLQEETIWPNKNLFTNDALEIIYNFLQWNEGQKIRDYAKGYENENLTLIYSRAEKLKIRFKLDEDKLNDEFRVRNKYFQQGNSLKIFVDQGAGIYEFLASLQNIKKDQIKILNTVYNSERKKGEIEILTKNNQRIFYKSFIKENQFKDLKNNDLLKEKQELREMNLFPNEIDFVPKGIPKMRFYLSSNNFKKIFVDRTSDRRYEAFLEIEYPDGQILERNILIKTRGNANRGFIKSSFTIESFNDFVENENFNGDEFFINSNEFKLRSFINEKTMIKEKLFYKTFAKLDHFAPDFFETWVEINGVHIGFYQVTEAVKENFFIRRDLETKNYYYAKIYNGRVNTDLRLKGSEEETLSHYKIKGSEKKLLKFLRSLDNNDEHLMEEINIQNVFDYAVLIYLIKAKDSLTHNFYVFYDKKNEQWNIFPWDGDNCFESLSALDLIEFEKWLSSEEGQKNNLIYYLFKNLSQKEKKDYFNDFKVRWKEKIYLSKWVQSYKLQYEKFFRFDNFLWNGKVLERKEEFFDTNRAIDSLLSVLEEGF